MKKRCLLPLFLSVVLVLGTSVPVLAQTLTLDTDGSDGYSGNVLMTLNTKRDFTTQDELDTDWEATGVPGAAGVSGKKNDTATTQGDGTGTPLTDLSASDGNLTDAAKNGSLQAQDTPKKYEVGDILSFNTISYYGTPRDSDNPTNHPFTAECVAVTDHCTLWFDTAPAATNYTKDQIKDLAQDLEAHAQIMEQTFGKSDRIDVDKDGKVAFVFYPLNRTDEGGYFDLYNLYSDNILEKEKHPETNTMDMINVNCNCSDKNGQPLAKDFLLSILCHEWQHLINNSQTMNVSYDYENKKVVYRSDTWLNESFSQSAMGVNGLANGMLLLQINTWNDYMSDYGNTLTPPFVFKDTFVASNASTYVDWFLFGRYLSAQTEGYTGSALTAHTGGYTGDGKIGGGDAIYQSIFNKTIDAEAIDPIGWEEYENTGYCTYDSLEGTLKDMGYLGSGISDKAENLNAMLRNFVIANTYQQTSGIYALGGTGTLDLSTIHTAKLNTAAETPQKLPGGYSAAFTKIDGGSIKTDGAGADIQQVGITVNYDGVQAEGYNPVNGAMNVNKGTQVSLSTTDTNVTIRYTTDGTDPTATTGTVYTNPITIGANTTIKAIDTDQWGTSSVHTFYYTIGRSASATTVTIDGIKGQPITPQTLTISLTGDQFKNLAVGDDVTSLFPNLTPGLKATVTRLYNRTNAVAQFFTPTVQAAESTEAYDTMDVTISGTPTVTGEVDLTLSIPAQYLVSGIAFTDVPLGTAKIDVTETAAGANAATGIQSDGTPMYIAIGLIAAAAVVIIIVLVLRKRQNK